MSTRTRAHTHAHRDPCRQMSNGGSQSEEDTSGDEGDDKDGDDDGEDGEDGDDGDDGEDGEDGENGEDGDDGDDGDDGGSAKPNRAARKMAEKRKQVRQFIVLCFVG